MSRMVIFSPQPLDRVCGNNTTCRRIAAGLRALGHEAAEAHVDDWSDLERDGRARWGRCDLLHALHAFKTGVGVRALALELQVPYVVTITGTDIHEDLERPDRRERILGVLGGAGALLCPTPALVERIAGQGVKTPCVVVPKGVSAPSEAPPPDAGAPILFLHAGGWREVKNSLFPLEPLARLARELGPERVRLRFLGPVLEPAYHARWLAERERRHFAEEGGVAAPERMAEEYRRAAVVLNTSHSEGGANAVLEAMAHGRAVLAADIPGNRAFLRHDAERWGESTGVLYGAPLQALGPERRSHDAGDFHAKARRLALDPQLRARIGANARAWALREHSPGRELEGILEAYRVAGIRAGRRAPPEP